MCVCVCVCVRRADSFCGKESALVFTSKDVALGWRIHAATLDGGMSSRGSLQESISIFNEASLPAEGQKGKGAGVMEGPIFLKKLKNFLLKYSWFTFFFYILFHYGLSQEIGYSSLCYTVGPYCLSILNVIVCIY